MDCKLDKLKLFGLQLQDSLPGTFLWEKGLHKIALRGFQMDLLFTG